MIEYKKGKNSFLAYWFIANVMILILTGAYVLRGHEWPSATYLIVINIMFAGFMLNRNQLIALEILEDEGIVIIEIGRWFRIRETLEYSITDIEARFEVVLRGGIFSKRDIFRIYVNDDKLVEVLPNEKGWPMETLRQIITDLDKYRAG